MLSVSLWATLLGTFTIAVISPGPDFLLVLRTALQHGRQHGFATAVGIAAGTAVWITATMAGLATLLHAYPTLNQLTRLAGAALLLYFGVRILVGIANQLLFPTAAAQLLLDTLPEGAHPTIRKDSHAPAPTAQPVQTTQSAPPAPPAPTAVRAMKTLRSSAALGFITTTVGNPKAVIFFSSLFASLLPERIDLLPALTLGTCMVLISCSWFLLVSTIAGNPRFVELYQRLQTYVDAVLGVLFIILAALLLPV